MAVKQFRRVPIKTAPVTPTNPTDADEVPVHSFDEEEIVAKKKTVPVVYGVFFILVLFGVITGFILSRNVGGSVSTNSTVKTGSQLPTGGKTVGVADSKTFTDSATGTIEIGGIGAEGTHKLVRPGGDSQTVYLISSIVDLDQFEGKEVTVWGQTMAAKKVAWLMDVGKVELK